MLKVGNPLKIMHSMGQRLPIVNEFVTSLVKRKTEFKRKVVGLFFLASRLKLL